MLNGHLFALRRAASPIAMAAFALAAPALGQTLVHKTETIIAKGTPVSSEGRPATSKPTGANAGGVIYGSPLRTPSIAPYLVSQNTSPAPQSGPRKPESQNDTGEDDAPLTTKVKKRPPSPNANVNLIYTLIDKGVLTEEQGQDLIKQAEEEAYVAREAAKTAREKAESAEEVATKAAEQVPAKGSRRVAYVPEIVKEQLRDDVRREVMAKAQAEGWAAPGALPEWTKRIRVFGDVRARYDGTFFPGGNANTGQFPDFNDINNGDPLLVATGPGSFTDPVPFLNVDEDRNRFRLRARFGIEANLLDSFFATVRVATGSDTSPVSTNQTLGANGSNFSKYQLWLDRASIAYAPSENFTVLAGRFENPFFGTDLIWDGDLGFDGVAMKLQRDLVSDHLGGFINIGAFPIYNTSFNFPATEASKNLDESRWLYGAQGGVNAKIGASTTLKLGVSYYDYDNVKGKLSEPCQTFIPDIVCSTDNLRPLFAQKGNTYIELRNVVTDSIADDGQDVRQYYGLGSDFNQLSVTGRLNLGYFSPFHIILDGEYVKNLAFDYDALNRQIGTAPDGTPIRVAINNIDGTDEAQFAGGDTGYLARVTVGHPELKERGDWNLSFAYKYLESDAVLDAFTDSDFGLGGTNLQGYIIGGKVALARNVWTEAKWMSADEIAGPPLAVDIFMLDLNAKF